MKFINKQKVNILRIDNNSGIRYLTTNNVLPILTTKSSSAQMAQEIIFYRQIIVQWAQFLKVTKCLIQFHYELLRVQKINNKGSNLLFHLLEKTYQNLLRQQLKWLVNYVQTISLIINFNGIMIFSNYWQADCQSFLTKQHDDLRNNSSHTYDEQCSTRNCFPTLNTSLMYCSFF